MPRLLGHPHVSRTETVRVPGDGARAVATGMMQSRGKLRPSDRSARLGAARIPRASNGYLEPRLRKFIPSHRVNPRPAAARLRADS